MEKVSATASLSLSITVYTMVEVPTTIGVPESVRVELLNTKPAGRVETLYVRVPSPPVASGSTRAAIAVPTSYAWAATESALTKAGTFGSGVVDGVAESSTSFSVIVTGLTSSSWRSPSSSPRSGLDASVVKRNFSSSSSPSLAMGVTVTVVVPDTAPAGITNGRRTAV